MVYRNIEYDVSNNNIHVRNSYRYWDDIIKEDFIDHILATVTGLKEKRNKKSLLNEWKAHNIFYQHGWWRDHTADVDLEFNQKWYYKIAWWLVAHVFKEKMI